MKKSELRDKIKTLVQKTYKAKTIDLDKGGEVTLDAEKFPVLTKFPKLKEPAIDAAVDALTGEEPHMGEPEPPMMEGEVTKIDKLAAKIAKALKDPKNKSAEDQNNIKQARKAMNDDKIETAEKILKPYLEEGLPKGFWDKKMKAKDETNESYETLKKKIQGQGKSAKAAGAIAGAIAAYKAKGGGKGPTAKQKK